MTLRIAVVGAGLSGRRHLALLAAEGATEIACIVDPATAADQPAAQYGVPRYPDLASMLDADRPDALIIAAPNHLHEALATVALEAGLPILLEKPATETIEAGQRLMTVAEETGVPVLVGHHRTHGAVLKAAREVVSAGRLGDLVAVNATALGYKPDDYFTAAPWRTEPGGGPIWINLIHEVHTLRLLCGEITEVHAVASHHRRGFAVQDTAAISFTFASGALGTVIVSDTAASPRSWEQTAGEDPSFDAHPDQDCYHLAGTVGSLSLPTMQLFTYGDAAERSWWKPFTGVEVLPIHRVDPLAEQLKHFAHVVSGRATPLVTLRDGVRNVKVVDAILRSAAGGSPVSLPPTE